jgi:hypothetical protein
MAGYIAEVRDLEAWFATVEDRMETARAYANTLMLNSIKASNFFDPSEGGVLVSKIKKHMSGVVSARAAESDGDEAPDAHVSSSSASGAPLASRRARNLSPSLSPEPVPRRGIFSWL